MMKKAASLLLLAAGLAANLSAQEHENNSHKGIPHLDHAFVIVMENHGYQQVVGNPNEPYLNSLIKDGKVNLATNYFAVGHPSLTNYLEIVGGSNFGVRSDNDPDWHNKSCTPNLSTGTVNADNFGDNAPNTIKLDTGSICPIAGTGKDALTESVDNWNEVTPGVFNFLANIDGTRFVPAAPTVGKTIADQLVEVGLSWKSYQESLSATGADGVNFSNGTVSNLDFDSQGNSSLLAPLTVSSVVKAYAAKHNPFVYFLNVQEGWWRNNSLSNVVGFDGPHGLYADLASGHVPSLAFIAPNQCDDQHGRGNGDKFCAFDPGLPPGDLTVGTKAGLNPGLIQQGDVTIQRLVEAIKEARVWDEGRNAIVIVWDENDYSGLLNDTHGVFPRQNQNNVVLTVELNHRGANGVQSNTFYTSFSLLKSLEAAFGLPCLNHACDSNVKAMSDLFQGRDRDDD
jgi:phosphatidylinositol-3-phosphatase